jgi:hypothetical protein
MKKVIPIIQVYPKKISNNNNENIQNKIMPIGYFEHNFKSAFVVPKKRYMKIRHKKIYFNSNSCVIS